MSRLIILEGARCTGKTTIAQRLRQTGINYATLINPTGFPETGQRGLSKIYCYYRAWLDFFNVIEGHDMTFIADRFFFSEMVFSKLYKDYDFTRYYERFCVNLVECVDQIDLLFFVAGEEALKQRATRDKADFAGNNADQVAELIKQQTEYEKVIHQFLLSISGGGVNFNYIDTTKMNIDQTYEHVLRLLEVKTI